MNDAPQDPQADETTGEATKAADAPTEQTADDAPASDAPKE